MENGGERELEQITNQLRDKYGFGGVLDAQEWGLPVVLLSVTDVLKFIPEFQSGVGKIREELGIDPERNERGLNALLGADTYAHYAKSAELWSEGKPPPLKELDDLSAVTTKIRRWEVKNFPKVSSKVAVFRISSDLTLPPAWRLAIKEYILYGKVFHISPPIFRKSVPKISIETDSKTAEPYLEIKIYSDTNPNLLKETKTIRKMQKLLPNYFDPDKINEKTLVRRLLYFVIRKHIGVSQGITDLWLENNGFGTTGYEHAGQEINRFLKTFKKSSQN